ncbi:MAG TPA: hypothetical protein VGC42_27835 [Kofleriaceae bacterium]
MSARLDVLMWAQRVVGRKGATPQQVLELPANATAEAAQDAFHKIARLAHPDLHRTGLTADELELVTTAYARAAAAYQELRGRPATAPPPRRIGDAAAPAVRGRDVTVPASPPPMPGPTAGQPASAGQTASQAMNSKALIYYRKAELCLRRGELTGAVLQLKMAIASDPQSTLLRSALAEVQAEVGKSRS